MSTFISHTFISHTFISHEYLLLTCHDKFTILPFVRWGSYRLLPKARDVAQRFLRDGHHRNQVNRGRCVQGYLKVQWKEVTMIQQEEVSETHNERRAL